MRFRVLQNFDRDGNASGFSFECDFTIDNVSVDSTVEELQMAFDTLEGMRNCLLCVNQVSRSAFYGLADSISERQEVLGKLLNACNQAEQQYMAIQQFLEIQGIASLKQFPKLDPALGEVLTEKKSSEF